MTNYKSVALLRESMDRLLTTGLAEPTNILAWMGAGVADRFLFIAKTVFVDVFSLSASVPQGHMK